MRARTRLVLDIALLVALVVAFRPEWTGVTAHQWLSIAIIAPLLVHLVVNWEWTLRIVRTFIERLMHVSRLNLVVDGLLFISAVTVMVSGFMVSPALVAPLGIHATQPLLWHAVHLTSANATIAMLAVHGLLHWRWFTATTTRLVAELSPSAGNRTAPSGRLAASARRRATVDAPIRRQSRLGVRAKQAAAERALAFRTLSVVGVTALAAVTVFAGAGLASPILVPKASAKSVATAGPMKCPKTGCTASRCHADYGKSAAEFYAKAKSKPAKKSVRRRPAKTASHTVHVASTTTRPAAKTAKRKTATHVAAAPAPKKVAQTVVHTIRRVAKVMTCPSTGCTASSCHGSHGVSASRWYKTH